MNRTIAKSLIFFFSLIGFIFLIIFIHENYHKFDFRNIAKFGEEICYLSLKNDTFGYYQFIPQENQEELIKSKKIGSELRAYLITLPVYFIYFWSIYFVLSDRKPKRIKEREPYK